MAVMISGPKGANTKKKMGKGGIAVLCASITAVAASVAFLFLGLSEYKDMRDMVLTWTELAEVAAEEDPGTPAATGR